MTDEELIEAINYTNLVGGRPSFIIMSVELYHAQRKHMYIGLGHTEDEAQKLADDDVEDLQQPETD
jgi:hypothetical protein